MALDLCKGLATLRAEISHIATKNDMRDLRSQGNKGKKNKG